MNEFLEKIEINVPPVEKFSFELKFAEKEVKEKVERQNSEIYLSLTTSEKL